MGVVNGITGVLSKHILDIKRIRNMHDEKMQELEIKRIIAQNNYQIDCQNILRLFKLDEKNNEYKLATLKLDDDKEINNIRENNSFINEKN